MRDALLVDTGPIVALLDRRDAHHSWAVATLGAPDVRVATCEPVLTEACFLVRHLPAGPRQVLRYVDRACVVSFRVDDEIAALDKLMDRYASVPMSLADACLVRMSEIVPRSRVVTLDSDFAIYRRHGRQSIPLRMPAPR